MPGSAVLAGLVSAATAFVFSVGLIIINRWLKRVDTDRAEATRDRQEAALWRQRVMLLYYAVLSGDPGRWLKDHAGEWRGED